MLMRALEFGGGIVVQRILRDPDDARVARLTDLLRQRRLAAAQLSDQKARPVPVETSSRPLRDRQHVVAAEVLRFACGHPP